MPESYEHRSDLPDPARRIATRIPRQGAQVPSPQDAGIKGPRSVAERTAADRPVVTKAAAGLRQVKDAKPPRPRPVSDPNRPVVYLTPDDQELLALEGIIV